MLVMAKESMLVMTQESMLVMVQGGLNPAALWAMSRLDPSVESPIQFHSIFTQIYLNPLRERFTP